MSAYAVIKTGGKQLRAAVDDLIVVEKLEGEPGDVVSFGEVLLHADGSDINVGAPTIANFLVHGEIADQRRAKKIIIFKKKRRQTYRRKKGHRQHETVVRITALGGDAPAAKPRAEKAAKPAPEKKSAKSAASDLPVLFLSAPNGEPDDLKKISGVGPVLEKKLHALGIFHFSQIAAFTADDVAKVDEVLNFKGRIDREEWIVQARALAAG